MQQMLACLVLISLICASPEALGQREEAFELRRRGEPTLRGTLLLPDAASQDAPVPGVVLIAGSGPTDRDGNQPSLKNDSLKRLAVALAGRGLAALRYDKRYANGTPGFTDPTLGEEAIRPSTFASDAAAVAGALAADPRVSGVTFVGHSEGALLALLMADGSAADAVVCIAGPGRPLADVLRGQLAGKLPLGLAAEAEATLKALEAGDRVEEVSPPLMLLFRPSVQPFLIEQFRDDPVDLAAALKKPLLVVQGGRDVQVSLEDARLLHAAAPGSELLELEAMNHVLRDVAEGELPLQSYTQPDRPLAAELADSVAAFVETHSGG